MVKKVHAVETGCQTTEHVSNTIIKLGDSSKDYTTKTVLNETSQDNAQAATARLADQEVFTTVKTTQRENETEIQASDAQPEKLIVPS